MPKAKVYAPEMIRNVALMGHSHCGKTTIAEAILFDEGATTRLGSVDEENSNFDFEPEEIKRHSSVHSHFGWVDHRGKKINLIDTPGDQNFFLDGITALLGADAVLAVVSAPDGVQLQTRRAWAKAREYHLPRAIFLNKMDRFDGSWKDLLLSVGKSLHVDIIPLQIPLGKGEEFCGVIDLMSMKAHRWSPDRSGKFIADALSESERVEATEAQTKLFEAIYSSQDALLEKYLSEEPISDQDRMTGLISAVRSRKLIPALFGSATKNIGIQLALDVLSEVFPDPVHRGDLLVHLENGETKNCSHNPDDPFLAQVIHTAMDDQVGQLSVLRIFSGILPDDGQVINAQSKEKLRLGSAYLLQGRNRDLIERVVCGDIVSAVKLKNTHTNDTLSDITNLRILPRIEYPKPMISYLLIPSSKNDEEKLKKALDRMHEEDPTLSVTMDNLTHHMVLHGMGYGHLENAIERLKTRYGLDIKHEYPPIPYRETFISRIENVEGKHKKQSGGAGQFGVCYINLDPLPRGAGFEFENKIKGGAIPRQFIPSVEKGIIERAKAGITAGYPLVDFRVTLVDGKFHTVDSKDIAFQMAGFKALKSAMETLGTKILEPFIRMEIAIPNETAGDVMGDIAMRRGQVLGMDTHEKTTLIYARCPQSEMRSYVAELHAMTQGKGSYTHEEDGYEFLPDPLTEKVQTESPFRNHRFGSDLSD